MARKWHVWRSRVAMPGDPTPWIAAVLDDHTTVARFHTWRQTYDYALEQASHE